MNALGASSFFNLDEEQNFPTWYSSTKLLLAALAAFGCWRKETLEAGRNLRSLVWLLVSALLVGLSLDETASVHEKLTAYLMRGEVGKGVRERFLGGDVAKDSFAWPILLAPLVIAAAGFLAFAIYSKMKGNRRALLLGLVACALFLTAVILETPAVYGSPPIETWGAAEIARYRLFTLIEESAEMLGATLLLAALLLHNQAWLSTLARSGIIAGRGPAPRRDKRSWP